MNTEQSHIDLFLSSIDKARLAEICRRYQVRELSLFGSTARGEQRHDSDIDILVEFEPIARPGFFALAGLQFDLEDLLHKPVDLVTKRGLKPLIRQQVLDSSIVLYAA